MMENVGNSSDLYNLKVKHGMEKVRALVRPIFYLSTCKYHIKILRCGRDQPGSRAKGKDFLRKQFRFISLVVSCLGDCVTGPLGDKTK
jgi:hypothetical protein